MKKEGIGAGTIGAIAVAAVAGGLEGRAIVGVCKVVLLLFCSGGASFFVWVVHAAGA